MKIVCACSRHSVRTLTKWVQEETQSLYWQDIYRATALVTVYPETH